jgi:hypothetical protein
VRNALVAFAVCLGMSGCVTHPDIDNPRTCEKRSGGTFVSGGVTPAVDEGNGFVSFISYGFVDTLESSDDFFLVQCSTGNAVTLVQTNVDYYSRTDLGKGKTRERHTLKTLVEELRVNGSLNDFEAVIAGGKASKFLGSLAVANRSSESAKCACDRFYPETAESWAANAVEN